MSDDSINRVSMCCLVKPRFHLDSGSWLMLYSREFVFAADWSSCFEVVKLPVREIALGKVPEVRRDLIFRC